MKRIATIILLSLILVISPSCERKKAVPEKLGLGSFPKFSLEDPAGRVHKSDELLKKGVVVVVTAPTLSNSGAQRGWDKHLTETMPRGGYKLVFLEDMEPSSFKETALKDMRRDFNPKRPPLLLIDHTGKVRKMFGAERDKTEVMVYDRKGRRIYVEKGKPSADSARAIWRKLKR